MLMEEDARLAAVAHDTTDTIKPPSRAKRFAGFVGDNYKKAQAMMASSTKQTYLELPAREVLNKDYVAEIVDAQWKMRTENKSPAEIADNLWANLRAGPVLSKFLTTLGRRGGRERWGRICV